MNTKELYDMILCTMSAEEALLKILESQINMSEYYVGSDDKKLNPTILIFIAANDLGWKLIPANQNLPLEERGVLIGGRKFIENISKIPTEYQKEEKKLMHCDKCNDGLMILSSFSSDYKTATFKCNNCNHEEFIKDAF